MEVVVVVEVEWEYKEWPGGYCLVLLERSPELLEDARRSPFDNTPSNLPTRRATHVAWSILPGYNI